MRRNDREVKERKDVIDILSRCDVIRLGIISPDFPYVVPMNFGFEDDGVALTIWLHSAPQGLKLELIRENSRVGFEADCSHKLITGDAVCQFTMEYESVIGCGVVSKCADNAGKERSLQAIMRHYAPERSFSFSAQELAPVCVLRLDVMQITGKRLKSRERLPD